MKNLQRLQGIDGDYDNDSGSGPDRIARRRTVHNLEKASKPRRQIGTLDVAFKKRFLKLTADDNCPSEWCTLLVVCEQSSINPTFFFRRHADSNTSYDNAP